MLDTKSGVRPSRHPTSTPNVAPISRDPVQRGAADRVPEEWRQRQQQDVSLGTGLEARHPRPCWDRLHSDPPPPPGLLAAAPSPSRLQVRRGTAAGGARRGTALTLRLGQLVLCLAELGVLDEGQLAHSLLRRSTS